MRAALVIAALAGAASGFGFAPRSARAPPAARSTHHVVGASTSSLSASTSTDTEANGSTSTKHPSDWESQIRSALSVVMDPDLDADIVSLGFVQNLQIDDSNVVSMDLELTTPACPVRDQFVQDCQDIINGLEWTRGAEVTLTAQPSEAPSGAPLGMSQIGAVIAVSSCKGGVGKSTTAVNLAFALESQGARVGIFDADVYGPSLPTMVTPEDDDVRFVGRQIAPLKRGGVSLMSFGYVNEGSAIMRGPMVTQLLDQFLSLTNWGQLDYLIMDMPPGTGDIQLTLTQKLNITAAVIVTTPQELSFVDVERGVEMFDTVEVPCVAVVENMAYLEKEDEGENEVAKIDEPKLREKFLEALHGAVSDSSNAADVADDLVKIVQENVQSKSSTEEKEQIRIFGPGHRRRLSEQFGIEHSFSVPLMGRIARQGDSGTPFVLEEPDSPQAAIYRELAQSVVGEVAKAKYGKGKGGGRPVITYDSEKHVMRIEEQREGEGGTMTPANLRRACRCAACVEELSGKQILDPASIPESVKPLGMSPTGNYALSVDWSDGHRSLYPYRQIRSLLEAKGAEMEAESAKEKAALS